jgi:anti-sigma factor RsiW
MTDADLNAFVDLELGADRLAPVMIHLFAEPEAAERVTAYARQRRTLAALRAAMDLPHSSQRLDGLVDELCRLVRRQGKILHLSRASGAMILLALVA